MGDVVDRRASTLDQLLSRRDLLKAGASLSLLAMLRSDRAWGESAGRPSRGARGRIVRAAIHPAIGIARVGNSPDEYYFGPEIPGGLPIAPGGYKDASGAMKRQAARFRIFGLDTHGRAVRELTAHDATIQWTVHLVNQKAAWYEFETALDIPEAEPTSRRNAAYQGVDRNALVIDPGPRRVSGRHRSAVRFDTGAFLGEPVYLGELRTDEQGRLLVLGGRGHSFSPHGVSLTTFANNDGWTDDTSDGPAWQAGLEASFARYHAERVRLHRDASGWRANKNRSNSFYVAGDPVDQVADAALVREYYSWVVAAGRDFDSREKGMR